MNGPRSRRSFKAHLHIRGTGKTSRAPVAMSDQTNVHPVVTVMELEKLENNETTTGKQKEKEKHRQADTTRTM
ncbi:hypothetical protein OUZ56_030668 [Daphnia magna]|uniref:Uncharacterized protein n=1 Tax=Daphnia magna TaxID=35525 RepID=A0ABQ9ZRY6_9CRUS|nr:hypothetical protein OUZ56_030668 [Daphnia magna]